ncbi:MAG: hypothetical protein UY72_C0007G0019 [Candidatus Uhrbacteria bacterium GW2011_GWD2_52_7]|uniref:Uncharacterized protein n=1 Tax=Candidatus Uhrbacteria bacterium GW2011_GWD2_52_7 TaxID=1618989 RepID=A0A0G1ZQY7_9BACT|nr:MAG: hypothetical protein UY72_C0007G0019 [Candidatus Uhrbacteria bacterium GW2011_GWD2_52_7]
MCHEALEKLEFTLEVTQFFQGDLIEETLQIRGQPLALPSAHDDA